MNIKLKELSKIGYTNNQARSIALEIIGKHCKHESKSDVLQTLQLLLENPEEYLADEIWSKLAKIFSPIEAATKREIISLTDEPKQLKVFGAKHIDNNAKQQMQTAMSLPIAIKGALMPDAHAGFGMPIGGVLAVQNAVIPYAVGVDIGCRMALTIFEETDSYIHRYSHTIKEAIHQFTHFGMDGGLSEVPSHAILDSDLFNTFDWLKKLQGKAFRQLGSSGSGNHFVEFGIIELAENNALALPEKKYLGLLSHSGSRGLGAAIAQRYIDIAMQQRILPNSAKNMAWLTLEEAAGKEYFLLMNFAGEYAKACHDVIHHSLSKALGLSKIVTIENHHNFAWKETHPDIGEVIVHRKGATPAKENEWGIIPGNMISPAYIVTGNGDTQSLYSASHGAGRAMSRQKAKDTFTNSQLKKILAKENVQLLGGSIEEAPMAYKNIDMVIAAQKNLVNIEGKFFPKIVRMNKV